MFRATEGNGGAPVVVGREPVEKPDIPRGAFAVVGANVRDDQIRLGKGHDFAEGAKATFDMTWQGYVLTYHDVDVISFRDGLNVFVGPHDVVTWEKV